MSSAVAGAARRSTSAFLSVGFRPFFLAAGTWAAIALALWICMLNDQLSLPTQFGPMAWHIHEMLFGFVMASVAGFLLTAIPNWTGRPPVNGWALTALLGLWVLGRAACLVSDLMPAWLTIVADLSFAVALFIIVVREIVAARNWRNLPLAVPVGVFALANLLMHLEAAGVAIPFGLGWRLGITAAIVLISAIGGRIVPLFTRNWLATHGGRAAPASRNWVDRAALGTLHTGLLGWAFFPDLRPLGYLLIIGGVFNGWRLSRWRGAATTAEPLLLVLHVGYAWLALGVTLLGLSLLVPSVPTSAAIHALTAGAIATMILAVMTRVTLGHTGRALTASPATIAIYVLVTLAALMRLWAAWDGAILMPLLILSGICWIAAFGLFDIVYGRMLVTAAKTREAA
ncbi:NnrS family protein [Limobrevibacterium gyesilva]|uniref:NnrS family protein n=1 Tax=Limobrevibacterium gyesilva TaxID=2991712 RepID=A0AA42CE34_9PROT|nr:NnrS family protein [Limobrevibacterium gyesilva]MCW3474769.1 NnrS family protein [Limobrevibacterium gyesilva]